VEQLEQEAPALFASQQLGSNVLPPLFSVEERAGGSRQLRVGDARAREDLLERVRRLGEQDVWRDRIQVGRVLVRHVGVKGWNFGCKPPANTWRIAPLRGEEIGFLW